MEQTIDRREHLSHEDFVAEYFLPRKPVIITDAAKGWGSLRWTPDMFRRRFGDREVTIDGKAYRMRDFIDAVEASTTEQPAPYLRSAIVRTTFPELFEDVSPPHRYMADNWLRLLRPFVPPAFNTLVNDLAGPDIFIGAPGAKLRNLHHDVYNVESFITQFYGTKQFVFYPPSDTKFLYPKVGLEKFRSGIADPFVEPDLDTYPLFAKATPRYITLGPGETLYVPCFWWHTSKVLTTSINGVFSVVNARNWADFADDVAFRIRHEKLWWWAAKPARLYLNGVGKILARRRRTEPLRG